jgi:ferredoxin
MSIYYFSGTGNSYYVAREISKKFNQSNLYSIAALMSKPDFEITDKEIVIVCPLYFYAAPSLVLSFIDRLNANKINYLSFVFTAQFPNGIAIQKIKKYCLNKNITVNSCFYLKMPTNYVIKSKMATSLEIDKTITLADKKLNKIIETINIKHTHFDKEYKIYSLIMNAEKKHDEFHNTFSRFDTKFMCSDACNSCRLCEKHCPVENIIFKGKPVWNGHCAACLKCINICPTNAIQYDYNATIGRMRYFNPKVKINEFK